MRTFVTLDTNSRKCGISEGCFSALVSKAGLSLEKVGLNEDFGVDYHIKGLSIIYGKISAGSTVLDVQLKGTQRWQLSDGVIKYPLRVKTYNDIVNRNIQSETRILLVLMLLHEDENSWCNVCAETVLFKNSLYYYEIHNTEFLPNPDSTTTISIPTSQVLTDQKLLDLFLQYHP